MWGFLFVFLHFIFFYSPPPFSTPSSSTLAPRHGVWGGEKTSSHSSQTMAVEDAQWSDYAVVVYAVFGMFVLALISVCLFVKRRHPLVRAKLVGMLTLMSVGGLMHITSAVISNQHFPRLTRLERVSCITFSYVFPYGLGAGVWFVALYLRMWVHNSAMSRLCNAAGARMARQASWTIVLATLGPVWTILVLGIATGASQYDPVKMECVSTVWIKLSIVVWVGMCALLLFVSLVLFWRTTGEAANREFSLVAFVALMGIIVATSDALVVLSGWLDTASGRGMVTFAVTSMYLWSVAVTAGPSLWHAIRKDAEYVELVEAQQSTIQVDIHDGLRRAYAAECWELVADFLDYCDNADRPDMDRGADVITDPMYSVAAFRAMENWLYGDDAPTVKPGAVYHPRDGGKENAVAICKRYLKKTSRWYIFCGDEKASVALGKASAGRTDAFDGILAWIIEDLDAHYGFVYINTDIFRREVLTRNMGIVVVLREMREWCAQERFEQAHIRVLVPDESDSSSGAGADLDALIDYSITAGEKTGDEYELDDVRT